MLVGLFAIDPVLGSRDWDLLCLSGISVMLFVTHTLFQNLINKPFKSYLAMFSVVCNALIILPWIHINHTDRSIKRVIQILDNDPGTYYRSHPIEMTLGMTLFGAKLYSLSQDFFEQALNENPSDPRILFNMGSSSQWQGDIDIAVIYYLQALAIQPYYKRAQTELLSLLLDMQFRSITIHAAESYFKVLYPEKTERDIAFSDFLIQLGQVAYLENQIDEAIEIWHLAYQRVPNNQSLLNNLGTAYYQKDDLERAVEFWEQAYQRYPNDLDIAFNLSKLYEKKGQVENAKRIIKQALKISPEDQDLQKQFKKLEQN